MEIQSKYCTSVIAHTNSVDVRAWRHQQQNATIIVAGIWVTLLGDTSSTLCVIIAQVRGGDLENYIQTLIPYKENGPQKWILRILANIYVLIFMFYYY